MARVPDPARAHYEAMQAMQADALRAAWRGWEEVRPAALSRTWRDVLPAVVEAVSAVQLDAATAGALYGAATLADQGQWVAPEVIVRPQAWVGYAASGAPLEAALYSPVPAVKDLLAGGAGLRQAMQYGRTYLEQLVRTTIADTGRSAASVDVVARPGTGYTRMLNPPSCDRCVVLAGRFYRWNIGFLRHPGCDCVHVTARAGSTAAARAEGLVDDPYEYFQGMSPAAQDEVFGAGNAQAIRDGADIYRVVNARRGARGLTTLEGAGRRTRGNRVGEISGMGRSVGRGFASGTTRLTPDGIYAQATSREQALRLLEDHGYILPGGQVPGGVILGRDYEGFGALGRGGTRVGARMAVESARRTGNQAVGGRYAMTEAQRRLSDAELSWTAVLEGRNPTGTGPLTPAISARVESTYRRWLSTGGQVFTT